MNRITDIEEVLDRIWDHSLDKGACNDVVIEIGSYLNEIKENDKKWKEYAKQAIEVIRNNVAPLSLYDREGDIIDEIENALKQL